MKFITGITTGVPGPADWVIAAEQLIAVGHKAVLVMITEDAGSTPRDAGAWMLVGQDATLGTLGGGELERMAEEAAKAMLEDQGDWRRSTLHCVLGPDLRQCCGGTVELALEPLDFTSKQWLEQAMDSVQENADDAALFQIADPTAVPQIISARRSIAATAGVHLQSLQDPRPQLFLFGAGHVGRSLCTMASQLPLRVMVIDSRVMMRALIPRVANVAIAELVDPKTSVCCIPSGVAVLVMTHSHELDYQICRTLLTRKDFSFIGLIGSRSKAARFRHRLRDDGLPVEAIERLTSPIGSIGPAGKEPGVIALAALSEIFSLLRSSDTKGAGKQNLESKVTSSRGRYTS